MGDLRAIPTLRWRPGPAPPDVTAGRTFPLIRPEQVQLFDDLVVWDSWPLLRADGSLFQRADGSQWWFVLGAPRRDDPEQRHAEARIRLLLRTGHRFDLLRPVFSDGLSPGSREWSGSASLDNDKVTLRFTAAGRRGEQTVSAEQRLFESVGQLDADGITGWSTPREITAAADPYAVVGDGPAIPGQVKGFRDPEPFRDHDGRDWLLFTGSASQEVQAHDGLIGLALVHGDHVSLLPPLVDGTGCTRELERPHIRRFGQRLYLFWSTQAQVFSPDCRGWPTGLYGATAERMEGPWTLLNGDGLVAANPPEQPAQAYSWLVLPDGSVTSFADRIDGRFLGGFAPFVQLAVDGERAWIAHDL